MNYGSSTPALVFAFRTQIPCIHLVPLVSRDLRPASVYKCSGPTSLFLLVSDLARQRTSKSLLSPNFAPNYWHYDSTRLGEYAEAFPQRGWDPDELRLTKEKPNGKQRHVEEVIEEDQRAADDATQ